MSIFDKTKETLQSQINKLRCEFTNFKAFVLKEMRNYKDDITKMLSRAEKNLMQMDEVVNTLFGEELDENSDTLAWDGNTAGCVQVGSVYKISDATPTSEDLANGFTLMMEINGVEKDFTSAATEGTNRPIVIFDGKLLMIGLYVFIVHEPCTYLGNTYNEKGTYFFKTDTMRVTSFKVNGYTGFVIRQFKPQFVDAYTKDQTNTLIRDTKNELSEEIADVRTDAHLEVVVEKRERESSINELDGRIDALESRGGSGGSGATSWKDLGEEVTTGFDTLTWDGNTEGLIAVEVGLGNYFYKISDDVFTTSDLANGSVTTYEYDGSTQENTRQFTNTNGVVLDPTLEVASVDHDNAEYDGVGRFVFPEKGTYYYKGGGKTTVSFKIVGYTGFTGTLIKPIDTKYLPEHLQFGEEEVELANGTYEFVYDENEGMCMGNIPTSFQVLKVSGESYEIVWDGTHYECDSVYVEGIGVVLGNGMLFGGEDNGLPFLFFPSDNSVDCIDFNSTASTTHDIFIKTRITTKIDRKYMSTPLWLIGDIITKRLHFYDSLADRQLGEMLTAEDVRYIIENGVNVEYRTTYSREMIKDITLTNGYGYVEMLMTVDVDGEFSRYKPMRYYTAEYTG